MSLVQKINQILKKNFSSDSLIEIQTLKDDNHLLLKIISNDFKDIALVQRHKMVYSYLAELFEKDSIHALKMNLKSKDEI